MIIKLHFEIEIKGDNLIGVQIIEVITLSLDQFQLNLVRCQS